MKITELALAFRNPSWPAPIRLLFLAETNPRFKTTTDQLRGLWQILARQKQY